MYVHPHFCGFTHPRSYHISDVCGIAPAEGWAKSYPLQWSMICKLFCFFFFPLLRSSHISSCWEANFIPSTAKSPGITINPPSHATCPWLVHLWGGACPSRQPEIWAGTCSRHPMCSNP